MAILFAARDTTQEVYVAASTCAPLQKMAHIETEERTTCPKTNSASWFQ